MIRDSNKVASVPSLQPTQQNNAPQNSVLRSVSPMKLKKDKVREDQEESKEASTIQMTEHDVNRNGEFSLRNDKTQMSITERTQNLYKNQQSRHQEQVSPVINQALQDDPEQHRVMYQYLFTENKRKATDLQPKNIEQSKESKYISALNTRRNPDILIPGGKFLKGNMYFKDLVDDQQKVKEKMEKEEGQERDIEEDIGDPVSDEDAFQKMKNQLVRYYAEDNPTIKCRNCKEYGHWAKDCPNEAKRLTCILCGKDTHDSFSCNEKLCFKCNKVGHKASECRERNIEKCTRCQMAGHREHRCLKVWPGNYTDAQLKLVRCIECGRRGHFKCTTENESWKIQINTHVVDDLNEFFRSSRSKGIKEEEEEDVRMSFDYVEELKEAMEEPKKSKSKSSKLISGTNVLVPEQSSHDANWSSSKAKYKDYEDQQGVPRHHYKRDLYCSFCGDRHRESQCTKSQSNRATARYQQYDKLRQKLADPYQGRDYYSSQRNDYRESSYYSSRRPDNHHMRLGEDPRKSKHDHREDRDVKKSSKRDQEKKQKYRKESSDANSSKEVVDSYSKRKIGEKQKKRQYESAYSDSEDYDDYDAHANVGQWDDDDSLDDSRQDSEELLTSFNRNLQKRPKTSDFEDMPQQSHRNVSFSSNNRSKSRDRGYHKGGDNFLSKHQWRPSHKKSSHRNNYSNKNYYQKRY